MAGAPRRGEEAPLTVVAAGGARFVCVLTCGGGHSGGVLAAAPPAVREATAEWPHAAARTCAIRTPSIFAPTFSIASLCAGHDARTDSAVDGDDLNVFRCRSVGVG